MPVNIHYNDLFGAHMNSIVLQIYNCVEMSVHLLMKQTLSLHLHIYYFRRCVVITAWTIMVDVCYRQQEFYQSFIIKPSK